MSIAWINEAEDGQKFALAKLKKLTGGGFITARGLMDKQMTSWLQTHFPIMTSNELPKAKADDAAFWSRAHIIKRYSISAKAFAQLLNKKTLTWSAATGRGVSASIRNRSGRTGLRNAGLRKRPKRNGICPEMSADLCL